MVQFLLNLGIIGKEPARRKRSGTGRGRDGRRRVFDGTHQEKRYASERLSFSGRISPPPCPLESNNAACGFFFEVEIRVKRLDRLLRRGRMGFFVADGEVQCRLSTGHEGNRFPAPKGSAKAPGAEELCNSQQFPNLREIDTDFTRCEIPLEPSEAALEHSTY